ncbi:MAG: tryptophan--tRNA ligase [Patescibacteria group bacterium]
MNKPVIVSGVQPSGQLHIGNYLGAIKNWMEIQNSGKYNCFFFIADYHSITENYDPAVKREQIFNLACDYLAAGLDPNKSTIFVQSQVPECTELTWIFNTVTPVSEMERMTQYKDKASRQAKNINMGLFDYPVLQAADILLYKGELVPVGQDQVQHVELTRDCARWFNNKYKTNYFPESKPLLTETPKIMSLATPENKMSKSAGDKHFIGIDESLEIIAQKLSKAVTTPGGIENLKAIYDAFEATMSDEFRPSRMSETKRIIAQGVSDHFETFRNKKTELKKNNKLVWDILEAGRKKASVIAESNIDEIKKIIGVV